MNDKIILNKIKKECSFNYMKTESKSDKIHLNPSFFRKGKINDWKNYLTLRQSNIINNIIYTKLYDTNIKYWCQINEQRKLMCKL